MLAEKEDYPPPASSMLGSIATPMSGGSLKGCWKILFRRARNGVQTHCITVELDPTPSREARTAGTAIHN